MEFCDTAKNGVPEKNERTDSGGDALHIGSMTIAWYTLPPTLIATVTIAIHKQIQVTK